MTKPRTIWEYVFKPDEGDLSPEAARYFLSVTLPDTFKERYQELAAKDPSKLSGAEAGELADLVEANTILMILQAKARRSLSERQPAA